jgi:hypothetical protein
MAKRATAAEHRHMDRVANLGCILCRRLGVPQTGKTDLHHVREEQGAGQRAPNWLVVPLCHDGCHQGSKGIHGDKTMLRIAKADEMDLLAWTLEALA